MWKMTDESPVASRRRHQAESSRTEAEEKKCLAACGLWEDVVAAGLVPGGRRWCVKVEGGPEGGGWAAEVAGRRRRQCWRHGGLQNRALEGRLVVFADAGKGDDRREGGGSGRSWVVGGLGERERVEGSDSGGCASLMKRTEAEQGKWLEQRNDIYNEISLWCCSALARHLIVLSLIHSPRPLSFNRLIISRSLIH